MDDLLERAKRELGELEAGLPEFRAEAFLHENQAYVFFIIGTGEFKDHVFNIKRPQYAEDGKQVEITYTYARLEEEKDNKELTNLHWTEASDALATQFVEYLILVEYIQTQEKLGDRLN